MRTPKRLLLWLLSIVLLTALAIGYVWHRWDRFCDEHGIVKFDWQGLNLSGTGLSLQQLDIVQQMADGARVSVSAHHIELTPGGLRAPLPPKSLQADQIEIVWQPASVPADQDDAALALPDGEQLQRWARWLPRTVKLPSVGVSLPCTSGICREQFALHWRHAGAQLLPAQLTIELQRNNHLLTLVANAHRRGVDTQLDAQLSFDQQPRLSMQSRLNMGAIEHQWLGSLAMNGLPEAPWLLEWLAKWLPYDPTPLPALPEAMRLGVGWALRFNAHGDLPTALHRLNGEVRLSTNLPAPWPIIGFGTMQGQLNLGAQAENGIWTPNGLTADLDLRPTPTLFAGIPSQLRPESISLVINPGNLDATPAQLPLDVQLKTEGASTISLQSQLLLNVAAPFALTLQPARLHLQAPRLNLSEFRLRNLLADMQLSGEVNQEHVALHLGKGSRVTLASLDDGADLSAANLELSLQGVTIEAALDTNPAREFQLKGPASAEIGQLNQPLLRPQSWRWSGQIDADSDRLKLVGPLNNAAGLAMAVELEQIWSSHATHIETSLQEIFFRAGNPLAGTFSNWPDLLELTTGRLQARAQFRLPGATATATINSNGLGGIYDRTELTGLDAQVALQLKEDQLQLNIPELSLQQANPGFAFGPLLFRGEYLAATDALDQGRIRWNTAQTTLFGGKLWLDEGEIDLAAHQQTLDMHLRGLQLSKLLNAYPTGGLSGTGIIDGNVKLHRSTQGLSIDQGSLQAREPGGTLQFRSAKIQALGQSNPAMRLVTEALDDFHYDLLASDVRYGEEGDLTLGVRLHGRNPALEGGRPINFSINLEENIPTLLTSLQLSDRVSETIQRRVQERLE